MTAKKPPKNGAELRRRILAEYQIDAPGSLALIDTAAQALDQAIAAEKLIKSEGLTVQGSRGPKPHPACNIARDARMRLLTALRQLDLEE